MKLTVSFNLYILGILSYVTCEETLPETPSRTHNTPRYSPPLKMLQKESVAVVTAGLKKKILAVDDEEVIRDFYRDSLCVKGYSVESAVDGLEALERLQGSVYDLVITDIAMPRLDGVSFYAAAVEAYPYLGGRFLFITGALPAGSRRFPVIRERIMLKPFKMNEFMETVSLITSVPLDEQLGRSPLDRRKGRRVFCSRDCYIIPDGSVAHRAVVAKTQDISASGLQIRYFGDSIRRGDRVRMRIGSSADGTGFRKDGEIVWARGANRFVSAGVAFTEPLEPSLMDKLKDAFLP